MDFLVKVLNAPNFITGNNKLARSAAFLFAFTVLHALPNFLLLLPGGIESYERYATDLRKLSILPVFEIYLGLSLIFHVFFAVKAVLNRPRLLSILSLTGSILFIFLTRHLLDFRFGDMDHLREILPSILHSRKWLYTIGIIAACLHAFQGVRPGWLFALDFRGKEISRLMIIGRILIVATSSLYIIPLVAI